MIQEKIKELDNAVLKSNICDYHKDIFIKREFINIFIIEELVKLINKADQRNDIILKAFNQIIVKIFDSYLVRNKLAEILIDLCRYDFGFSYFHYNNPLFANNFGFKFFCTEDILKIVKAEFARMILKGVNDDSDKAFLNYLINYFSDGLKGDLFLITISVLKELKINTNVIKTYWNEKVSVEKLYDFFDNMASDKGNDEKIITIKDLNDLEDNPNTYLEGWGESVYHKIALSPIEHMSEKELAICFEFLIKKYFFDCFKIKIKDENIKYLKNVLTKDNLRDYSSCESTMEAFSCFLDNEFFDYLYSLFNEKINSDKIKEPNYQNTNYDELFEFCCKVLEVIDLSHHYTNDDSLSDIVSNFLEHKVDRNRILEVLVNNIQKVFFDEFEEQLNYLEVFFDEFDG